MIGKFAIISKASPRYDDWLYMLGSDHAPIESTDPVWGIVPGVSETLFYKLDCARLTPEQRGRVIEYLARKFKRDKPNVECALNGPFYLVPILAEDVTVVLDRK